MAKYVRKAPKRTSVKRKSTKRSTKKNAVGPNSSRSSDSYSFSYFPGQSSNRDRPIQVFENRHNRKPNVRTYNTPREVFSPEDREPPSGYYVPQDDPPDSPTGTPDIAPPAEPITEWPKGWTG